MKPLCLCLFVLVSASFACGQSSTQTGKVLTKVADISMPGPAVRFDYQAFDPSSGRLYIAHMNADQLVVFDTIKRQVIANLDGFRRVHGVTVAPELHRLYASVTGNHQVAAVDTESLKTLGTAGPITYPDGLAYAPKQNKVFVSDEHGGVDAVIDAASNLMTRKTVAYRIVFILLVVGMAIFFGFFSIRESKLRKIPEKTYAQIIHPPDRSQEFDDYVRKVTHMGKARPGKGTYVMQDIQFLNTDEPCSSVEEHLGKPDLKKSQHDDFGWGKGGATSTSMTYHISPPHDDAPPPDAAVFECLREDGDSRDIIVSIKIHRSEFNIGYTTP
jgi:hypothetical protein